MSGAHGQPAAVRSALDALLPDEDETLLIRACLRGGGETAASWAAWRERHPDPVGALREFGPEVTSFTPLLHKALREAGADPGALATPLAAGAKREQLRAAKVHAGSAEALAVLVEAGIEPLVLRGVPLAELAYPAIGLRHTYDVDLLVTPAEQAAAADALRRRGGSAPDEPTPRGDLLVVHPLGVPVDLHTRLYAVRGPTPPLEQIRARRRPATVSGAAVSVLATDDEIVHVIGQALPGRLPASLRWVPDVWFALRREPDVDWERLAATADESRLSLVCLAALEFLRERLDGPVPDDALEPLRSAAARSGRAERDFVILAALRASRRGHGRLERRELPSTALAVARRLPVYLADRVRGRGAVPAR